MKLSNLQTPVDQDMETATAAGVVDCLLRFLKGTETEYLFCLLYADTYREQNQSLQRHLRCTFRTPQLLWSAS